MTARDEFNADLLALLDEGRSVPCAGRDEWTSDEPDERAHAAEECVSCPLLEVCADLATEERHKWGVWGGLDR
ncbi:transcriptional regulator, partial [Intrasporangium chromatireducens Q5-1]